MKPETIEAAARLINDQIVTSRRHETMTLAEANDLADVSSFLFGYAYAKRQAAEPTTKG